MSLYVKNITKGEWVADGVFMEDEECRRVATSPVNGIPGETICECYVTHDTEDAPHVIGTVEAICNAKIIAEAGTVANETGLTPRQLLDQRDALIKLHRINVSTMAVTKHRLAERGLPTSVLDTAIRETEQAIVRAEAGS